MKFNIIEKLEPLKVNIDNILLDPNNPRFADIESNNIFVNERRFAEPKIQDAAIKKMKQNFDVDVLVNTIKEIGFLPIDKIIIREWSYGKECDIPKYVVIEGNRRITALKNIMEQYETGIIDLTDEQIDNFSNINVLLLRDADKEPFLTTLIPGLRHVSGIKDWGPYQKSKLIYELREIQNLSSQESAEAMGLSILKANNLYRSYKVFTQMTEDEEYGDLINARMFSFAEETIKQKALKDWLSWDDKTKEILNKDNLNTLLSLFVVKDDESEPKISAAIQIRNFAKIIESNDKRIINYFLSKEGSLTIALSKLESINISTQWKDDVINTIDTIDNLTQNILINMPEEELELLKSLKNKIECTIDNVEKLRK